MDQSAISRLDAPTRLRAEFYFDEFHNRELCKVWVVGDTGNVLKRVTPEVIAQFPKEWELYQKTSGAKEEDLVGGTPLREVPGVTQDAAAVLRYNAIRNAEELAGIDEHAARSLGLGILEFHRAAKNLIAAKKAEAADKELSELRAELEKLKSPPRRGPGRPRKEDSEPDQVEFPDNAA